jgi:two-component system, OmpR family, sensor kinase
MTAPVEPSLDDEVAQRLSSVAHELLNPLAVAQGYASLLVDHTAGADETVRQFAQRVSQNVEVAVLLMQRLRDSVGDPTALTLQRSPLDMREVVHDTVTDLAATIAAGHPIEVDLPGTPVLVDGDETRLRQVLFNLVSNGAKYSPDESPIEVNLSVGELATVEVRNHGFGVAPDDVERLFELGARGGEGHGRGGSGVGLYVSRIIAEAHGGSLRVEPAEIQGSRFILDLPTVTG